MGVVIGYPGSSLEDVLFSVCFHIELTEYVGLGDTFSVHWCVLCAGGDPASSVDSVTLESWVWVSGFSNWGKL